MKKFLQIPLLLAVALLTSIPISAHKFEVDGIFYNILDESAKTVIIYGYRSSTINDNSGNVVIPETVTYSDITYSVTAIDGRAFYGCTGLTSVNIPNSVTHIYSGAFYGCTGLTSVNIPNSVTSIGVYAFDNTGWYNNQPDGILYLDNCCLGWKGSMPAGKLVLNNNTRVIADYAFRDCTSLTSVNIPNSVTSIGGSAFWDCTSLTSVNIPNSVTSIGSDAFWYTGWHNNQPDGILYLDNCCLGWKGFYPGGELILNNNTRVIADCAFYYYPITGELNIPNSITKIGNSVFNGTDITSVNIPNSVTTIGGYAFGHCYNLTSVTIPNSVTSIGDSAFRECTGLTSVNIPNSVTSIGYAAFYNCTGLTSVNIPNSVTAINSSTFGYTGLTKVNIPNSVTHIDSDAFSGCTGLTEVNIPTSVTSIGERAFSYCSNLTSVTIPNSVTHIDSGAFYGCTGLTSVNIPNSVTSIEGATFYECTGLTSVPIPNSVTFIGKSAFYGCTGLTSVAIPNSVTLIWIKAFYGCSGLTEITIPNSVTSIGESAFEGCTGLTSVTSLNPTPPECGVNSFYGGYSANLYVPAGSIKAYSTSSEWEKFENIAEFANVTVSTQADKASFEIPTTEGAASYTVDVYSNNAMTQLVASTNYDANGKIVPMSTTLELSLDGFANGVYFYAIVVKSSAGEVMNNYKGTFEIDSAGISNIATDNATEIARYDIHGRVLSEPISGLNIVVFSDGSIRKMYIK